jgi:hypothetical protein
MRCPDCRRPAKCGPFDDTVLRGLVGDAAQGGPCFAVGYHPAGNAGSGWPMPSRRTLPPGILPSGRSEETSLRNPAALGFLRRSIGTGHPSQSIEVSSCGPRLVMVPVGTTTPDAEEPAGGTRRNRGALRSTQVATRVGQVLAKSEGAEHVTGRRTYAAATKSAPHARLPAYEPCSLGRQYVPAAGRPSKIAAASPTPSRVQPRSR